LYAGTVILEFKNLRHGRVKFFTKQLISKFPVAAKVVSLHTTQLKVNSLRRINTQTVNF
jgi:hypothetical protein